MSDARSAGSSEAPKKAGRDEAGTVCDASSGSGFYCMYVGDEMGTTYVQEGPA